MISERVFSRRFSSYWRNLLPMSEQFVRKLNLNSKRFSQRYVKSSSAGRRALINETAFLLAKKAALMSVFETGVESFSYNDFVKDVGEIALTKIIRIEGDDDAEHYPLRVRELSEVISLSKNILDFILSEDGEREFFFSPNFRGCGLIDECEGDLIVKDTLCEIKAGERAFRSQDIRQIFIYLCLNKIGMCFPVNHICFVNPRFGVKFKMGVEDFVVSVSGRSFSETADYLLKYISDNSISS